MNCEQARAAIADSILAPRQDSTIATAELQSHLESCAACRAYRDECQAIWAGLATLSVPAPATNARARFDEAVSRIVPLPARKSSLARGVLMAASVIVAALGGYAASSWNHAGAAVRAAATASADSEPHYLLLLYDDTTSSSRPSSTELKAIVAEYSQWATALHERGQLILAEELSDNQRRWLGGDAVHSGEFTVGGLFLIRAHDLAEAERIAASCPHVKRGRVELRTVQPT